MRVFIGLFVCAGLAVAADKAPAPIKFEDATAKAGIQFTHSFGAERLGSLLESTGAGCVWFDYNNDGLPDLFVTNGRPLGPGMHPHPLRKPPAETPHNHLYRNNGDGTFTDVTDKAGVGGDSFSFAAIAADYDNDGHTDLLVTSYGKVTLYHNNGNGTFTDVTEKAGIKVDGWAIGAAWLDYDKDGCVDLFIGRYVKFDPTYHAYYAPDNYPGPLDYEGDSNLLFHNNCNGTFTDVSEKSGIAAFKGRTMGVTAADFSGSGYPDIYVANDKTENFLFHNKGDGTFEEIAVDAGVAFGQNGEMTGAMGPVFFDLQHDGSMALWVTDSKYNRLLKNMGGLKFRDITDAAGISQANAQYTSWASGVYDFDNDGLKDIPIFHGGLINMIPEEHSVFQNLGNEKFRDVSATAGPILDNKTVARGGCFADYDNDGKIDAFVVNLGAPATLLHNTTQTTNHWLMVKLEGTKSNRDGIGAKVQLVANGVTQYAQRVAGSSYLGQDDWRLHFGLGSAVKADKITVIWPSGIRQTVENVKGDQIFTIREAAAK
jgi:enediyne biosynthesis protein E4